MNEKIHHECAGCIHTSMEEEGISNSLEAALEELNHLVGLDTVKKEIYELVTCAEMNHIGENNALNSIENNLHLAFIGNPGTGKTTVARIVGKIYKALGLLSKGHIVEVSRIDLVGQYVGRTSAKTQSVIDEAVGGVLFIDDPDSLVLQGKNEDLGWEAISVLLKGMEDHCKNLAVIIAGCPEQIERFIQSTPGLRSQFEHQICFEDYTPSQLTEILQQCLEKADYFLDEPARELAAKYIEYLYKKRDKLFGNAHEMQNLRNLFVIRQTDRLMRLGEPSAEELRQIIAMDVEEAIKQRI